MADTYVKILQEARIPLDAVYIFGSYARGSQHESSDIDVAVVSSLFGKSRSLERVQLMLLRNKQLLDIEPHPLGTEDFASDWNPFVKVVKEGVRIR